MERCEQLIRAITEGTAPVTGEEFFRALVRHLATVLQLRYAFVAECLPGGRARSLAFWQDGALGENLDYFLAETPCLEVAAGRVCFHPQGLRQRFPKDDALVALGAESYLGVPVLDSSRRIIGHLVVMDDLPMFEDPLRLRVLETFAARAGAEIERLRADKELHRLNAELDALLAMNRAIGRHLSRDELFGALAWSLQSLLPTDRFGIELPIPGDQLQGHILAARGAGAEPTQTTLLPAAGTACDWVMQHREWVVTVSREELRRFPVTFEVMAREGMESLCAMALVSGDRCLGALFFMAAAKAAYTQVRRGFLEQVVSAVSVALDDCLAHEELGRLRDRLVAENVYLQEEISVEHNFEEIVGSSAAIKSVFKATEQVAATDATVVLLGETGTGKELIARAIHKLSRRKERVLVKVNCSAIPPGLIESELFGHEKGAFTGALARKIGRFELADGATVFLDEVGDLPLDLQPKLLRVLQEGEFERLGNSRTIKTDVRVIAATNQDLDKAVANGSFRADLFYRLNVFPIRLPALRERGEDISLLVKYFAQKHGAKLGKCIKTIPQPALAALEAYPWPGNVRELENVIERAAILSRGPELDLGDCLPRAAKAGRGTIPEIGEREPGDRKLPPAPARLGGRLLEDDERERILMVLGQTGWRVSGPSGAARVLGVKPTTLEARMKRLGIRRPEADLRRTRAS